MAHTAYLVCFISTFNGRNKKRENALEDVALVAGTQQNLSNLYAFRYLCIRHSQPISLKTLSTMLLNLLCGGRRSVKLTKWPSTSKVGEQFCRYLSRRIGIDGEVDLVAVVVVGFDSADDGAHLNKSKRWFN
jgi:hypothetical protein